MLPVEGREPLINTLLHLAWHAKTIREKQWIWLEQRRKRLRRCEWIPMMKRTHWVDECTLGKSA
jgi:hypothetical protein